MVGEGLLREDQTDGERRGRRGVRVRLNPRFGYLAGFDMEAKRLRLVVTDFAGQIMFQARRPLRQLRDRQALLDEISDFIDASLAEAGVTRRKLLGFGLAASGVMDTRR